MSSAAPREDCTFCQVLHGGAPASLVLAGERVAAFLDMAPRHPGHTLVAPLDHHVDLASIPPEVAAEMFTAGQRVAAALRRHSPETTGVNLLLSDGAVAGQDVFHAHLHVIPRSRGDGGLFARARAPTREQLDATARELRHVLAPGA